MIVRVADEEALAAVLNPVYSALGVPFMPESVSSIATAGSPDDINPVADALKTAFGGGRTIIIVPAAELIR